MAELTAMFHAASDLTPVSPTILLLQQISELKHQIDQINAETEAEIKKTKEIEREIVQTSEKEQQATQEREKWKKILIQKEVQHMDLEAVAATSKASIAEAEESLDLTRKRREELYSQIENERDAFIETCKIFQLHQHSEAEDETELKLIERNCNLLIEVAAFKKNDEALKITDEILSKTKVDKLRELQTINEGPQAEFEEENAHNQKLLKRIETLDGALLYVRGNEDISKLQAELDNFTEEKRNLEDGIVTLQKQIPLLLNHEEKLGGLLKEQQQVLQSLERKLEEVRALQEAHENDTRREDELLQTTQPKPTEFDQVGPSHNLRGTRERSNKQGGKRHRLR